MSTVVTFDEGEVAAVRMALKARIMDIFDNNAEDTLEASDDVKLDALKHSASALKKVTL